MNARIASATRVSTRREARKKTAERRVIKDAAVESSAMLGDIGTATLEAGKAALAATKEVFSQFLDKL
jgi:hypothetical protein